MIAFDTFIVPPFPTRVVFGPDSVDRIADIVDEVGAQRVLIIASRGRTAVVDRVRGLLGARCAGTDFRAEMHVPAELAETVGRDAEALGVDLSIAIGGGSAIGMSKALAFAGGPPLLAIPTTYSGSEMTSIWGMTRNGTKTTGRDDRVRPRVVLYDPLLSAKFPARIAVPSGLNALAHCVEALYAPDANPVATLCAVEGADCLLRSLPRIATSTDTLEDRTDALRGAWMGGFALGTVQMGLHHKLCHTLGGTFALPHAETHAILLPHSVAYNARAAAAQLQPLITLLHARNISDVPERLHQVVDSLLRDAGAPRSLGELGFRTIDAARAARVSLERAYANPAPLNERLVTRMLENAVPPSPSSRFNLEFL